MNKKSKNKEDFMKKLDCHASLAMTLGRKARSLAFTMAEILLSLTIIGIVAAITLPSLTANFQDKAFNTKRQALHARLSQAFRMMDDFSEYMPINSHSENDLDEEGNYIYKNVNKFMDDLSKSLSIKVISDPDTIFGPRDNDCAEPSYWCNPLGNSSRYPFAGWPTGYFQTTNGESVGILFGNPQKCDKKYPGASMMFALVYDLNGKKGPNKWGKDMGIMGAFYYDNIELYAPMPGATTGSIIYDDYDEGNPDSQKYKYPDYRLATPEELTVIYGYTAENFRAIPNDNDTLCSIDGNRYNYSSIFNENEPAPLGESEDGCIYPLVTNDGNYPKDGFHSDF